ncbi:MAG: hypothetical protein L0Y67_04285 [Gammaproteobacteria bacterium]|nr:hypothetical protein [Gammaproteobacteria bacterium]
MSYMHPGCAYVNRYGEPVDELGILRYADFLRREAQLSPGPLANFQAIYEQFGMPRPGRVRLPKGRGFVLNPDTGHIVVAEDDPASVQRFTEGHELFELLFAILPTDASSAQRLRARKEALCDTGSAWLLMDAVSYTTRIRQLGVSLASARQLAIEYGVSLTAALRRVVDLASGQYALVIWHLDETAYHSPTRLTERRTRRLYIQWAWGSTGIFIPRDQAISEDTSIYRAYELGLVTISDDQLNLVGLTGACRCESKPFMIGPERKVISLIHLPGDIGCKPDVPKP